MCKAVIFRLLKEESGKPLCFIEETLFFAEEGHGGAAWLPVPSSDGRNTDAEVDAQSADQWHSGRL